MMPLATSKNLTILGIATLLAAVASAAIALFDGDPSTNPNFTEVIGAVVGLFGILAKGAQSTGGTVPQTPEAQARVQGFIGAGLAFRLSILSLALVLALSGAYFAAAVVGLLGLAVLVGLRHGAVVGTAVMLLALVALPARAEDPAPVVTPATLCFNSSCSVSATPGVAVSGSVYDLQQHTFIRSFQISGLFELRWKPSPLGLALGASFQTGDRQGITATQVLTFPGLPGFLQTSGIGVHEMFWGDQPSVILPGFFLVQRF